MNQAYDISVIVPTRNRYHLLQKCIHSLLSQSHEPRQIYIIDNNSDTTTSNSLKGLCSKYKSLTYVLEKKVGRQYAYNRGLKLSKTNWVASIDDDCLADKDWIKNLSYTCKKYPNAAAIIGWSKTISNKNIYSLATYIIHTIWKQKNIHNNQVVNLEILDSKNILYSKSFLNKHNLIKNYGIDRPQDVFMGLQIQLHNGTSFLSKKALVYHQDPTSFFDFIKQRILQQLAYKSILKYTKTHSHTFSLRQQIITFITTINHVRKVENISKLDTIKIYLLFIILALLIKPYVYFTTRKVL